MIMKHTLQITLILVAVFLVSQGVGLYVVDSYFDHEALAETGELAYGDLPLSIERPEIEEGQSFIYILVAILIGTVLLLLLIKFKKMTLWRIWFLLAVVLTLAIAFSAFMDQRVALTLALIFGFIKVYKPNVIVHNLTEIFIYGGLAAIFVPIMNMFAAVMLLVLISIYDMYAVWKSKHMITLAKFQTDSKVFAGLSIPYSMPKKGKGKKVKVKECIRTAILGGGDIGFPLIFAGVVMKGLFVAGVSFVFLKVMIIPIVTSIALLLLFIKGKKDTFYPAMPFLSAGCFLGYGILLLVI